MTSTISDNDLEVRISRPTSGGLDAGTLDSLREELGRCSDVAFAHLPEVLVRGQQEKPELMLFVWLVPDALRSLRAALDLVAAVVAEVLPDGRYLDVAILNSTPDLLLDVEQAGCLVVERDPAERTRALAAARAGVEAEPAVKRRFWWRL